MEVRICWGRRFERNHKLQDSIIDTQKKQESIRQPNKKTIIFKGLKNGNSNYIPVETC